MTSTQQAKARLFRSLHTLAGPLALANAWDAASARVIESAGAPAIATTSAGVAWSLGGRAGRHRRCAPAPRTAVGAGTVGRSRCHTHASRAGCRTWGVVSVPGACWASRPETTGPTAVPAAKTRLASSGPAMRAVGPRRRVISVWTAPVAAPRASGIRLTKRGPHPAAPRLDLPPVGAPPA
ncbi:isocitrate lyase/phosphoenolpyruvate mutase family protein [Streptomyces sp. PSAA01]|uniref:isocitrate lyase/phosphoenolpyruvate mutase family protein n=1 Tax=Streptomyces sp. PSAA01 TaxID=2912762 RepID=UPI0035AB7D36